MSSFFSASVYLSSNKLLISQLLFSASMSASSGCFLFGRFCTLSFETLVRNFLQQGREARRPRFLRLVIRQRDPSPCASSAKIAPQSQRRATSPGLGKRVDRDQSAAATLPHAPDKRPSIAA